MAKLEQVIHHLFSSAAAIADDVIQIPLVQVIVDHDQRDKAPIGKIAQEMMAVVAAQAEHAVDVPAFKKFDMGAGANEIRLGLLEHDFIAKFARAVADPADQFPEVGIPKSMPKSRQHNGDDVGIAAGKALRQPIGAIPHAVDGLNPHLGEARLMRGIVVEDYGRAVATDTFASLATSRRSTSWPPSALADAGRV